MKNYVVTKCLSVHILGQFLLFFPRDLRPTNILLGEHGHVLLTYFSQWRGVDRPISFSAQEGFYTAPGKISFLWPSARLRLLQCISNGVTVVLSLAINDQYAVHLSYIEAETRWPPFLKTISSYAFSVMKTFEFQIKFH